MSHLIFLVNACPVAKQSLDNVGVAMSYCYVERTVTISVHSINISSVF